MAMANNNQYVFLNDNDYHSITGNISYNNEYLEDMINRMVKEEVLLQIDPNLYLFSVLTDSMKLDYKRIKEAKEILERKVNKC